MNLGQWAQGKPPAIKSRLEGSRMRGFMGLRLGFRVFRVLRVYKDEGLTKGLRSVGCKSMHSVAGVTAPH